MSSKANWETTVWSFNLPLWGFSMTQYRGSKYLMISIVLATTRLEPSMSLMPLVLAMLYSVQGGDAQISSKFVLCKNLCLHGVMSALI